MTTGSAIPHPEEEWLDELEGPSGANVSMQGVIIRQFLLWTRTAPADHRADAVEALARAIVRGDLPPEDRGEAELALLAMLDDPAPAVRRAIAAALAPSRDAPRALLSGLLQDRGDVAAPVLEHSPLLGDSELVDHVALCDTSGQCAVARRATVSPGLAGALAEVGALPAVLALLGNPGARLADGSLKRIVERFGHEPAVRDLLLSRPDLPVEIRLTLAAALTRSLNGLAAQAGGAEAERLEQRTRDACERAVVAMALDAGAEVTRRIVAHLRGSGQLTPGLILRAALSGAVAFVEAALADLTGVSPPRAAALLRQRGAARDALYRRAGLPGSLRPALLATLSAVYRDPEDRRPGGLSRRLIDHALEAAGGPEDPTVSALLQRYGAEAARDEARRLARAVVAEANALQLTTDDLLREAPALAPPRPIEDGSAPDDPVDAPDGEPEVVEEAA